MKFSNVVNVWSFVAYFKHFTTTLVVYHNIVKESLFT